MATCCNPGCDQPGTNLCSACKEKTYCGPICQTADWPHHKEECPGHLRKVGMANLKKAMGLQPTNPQRLHYAEFAIKKLKLLKDCPFEALDNAFAYKTTCLRFMGRHTEAMENAKERYTMWAMTNIRHSSSIWAAFDLIDGCIHLGEYVDAELFARTAFEIINEETDNIIPQHLRQQTLARGSSYLAHATFKLAEAGGIATEAKQAAGVKVITLLRTALEIESQLHGAECVEAAVTINVLAQAFNYFNDIDDDEVLHLLEQAKAIFARVGQRLSLNTGASESTLGLVYNCRAKRAYSIRDLDRCVANDELALLHYREVARIKTNLLTRQNETSRRLMSDYEQGGNLLQQ